MKILFIPSWYPYSENPYAGKFFVEQAKALAKQGIAEITLLNWGQNEFQIQLRKPILSLKKYLRYKSSKAGYNAICQNLIEISLPHLSWTSRLQNGNIDSLINKLELKDKPDLIHAQVTFPAGYIAWKLSRKYNIPFVITEHSGPFPFKEYLLDGVLLDIVSKPLMAANHVLAVSTHLANEIHNETGVTAKVIPNMVDTDFYLPSEEHSKNECFRLFSLSALTASKGIWDLLEAVNMAKQAGIRFKLYWGGDGSLRKPLQRKIDSMQLQNWITLLGNLNPAQSLLQYQQCDCFVMPSRIESFSMVIIEALACGKPVIATNCGGPADILSPLNGILVSKANPKALSSAINTMAETYDKYSAEAIRKDCISRFSEPVVSKMIGDIYQQCCTIV
ncbi:MAG: glycosyltransferase [Candidatus Cloacimonetes bacterium]|nr:glycosyltransferase [Candidatus Cloacimonadota bacterium]